jgi:O-antigen ligase
VTTNGTTTIEERERTWSANALKYGLSIAIRLDTLWPNAVKGFMRNPLLGSGYATLNKESDYHFTEADSTDNNYLRALGETGLLGFVAFFGIIFLVLKQTSRNLFSQDILKSSLAIGLFAGTVGLLINATYIDVYAASKVAFTYWAVVGFTLAVFTLKTPSKPKKNSGKQTLLT